MKCFKQNCKSKSVNKYFDYRSKYIWSCLTHKPMGWKRIRK